MRPPWESLPPWLQEQVGAVLGSPVVEASSAPGGFSPGVAARVRCASGRRAFVKAASGDVNAHTVALHRREAEVTAVLPPDVGAPRLLGVVDAPPWVALVLEQVDGRPPRLPWEPGELDACLGLLDRVGRSPAPGLAPAADVHVLDGWQQLAEAGTPLTPWEDRHLARLVDLERQWPQASAGAALLHLDVRSDNLLLRRDGGAVLVDWPHAGLGHPVVDLVLLAPSAVLDGAPDPEALLLRSAAGRAAEAERVDAVVAAFAGYLVHGSRQPPPPGMTTLRAFQAAQGDVALRWLAARTGWA